MDKNYFIRLTMAVYRVTELFPENEPLKLKIREKANDLLADLIGGAKGNPGFENEELTDVVDKDITVINSFFELAETQGWVDPVNFLVLKKEYGKIKEIQKSRESIPSKELLGMASRVVRSRVVRGDLEDRLNERQRKILKVLEKKDRVQVWEIKEIFSGVTKRTLRRDFEDLLNKKLIKRMGERNETFYRLVGR